jgi:hypothetical protein
MNKIIFDLIIFVILSRIPILNIFVGYLVYRFAFKNGIKKTKTLVFVGSAILLVIDRFYLISIMSIGFALCSYFFIKLSNKFEFNFRILILIFGMLIFINMFFYKVIYNVDNVTAKEIYKIYNQHKQQFQSEFDRLEFENPDIDFEQMYKSVIDYSVTVLPGTIFAYIFLGNFLAIFVFYYNFLMQKDLFEFGIPNLKKYYVNDNMVWFFIIIFAVNIFLQNNFIHNNVLEYMIPNLMIIFLGIYFLQGILICMYFLRKINFYLPIFIVIVLLFFMLISFIGVFDIWFDYRKIRTKNKEI